MRKGGWIALVACAALMLSVSACTANGPEAKSDLSGQAAAKGVPRQPLTLTVWDQHVRAGQQAEMKQLNEEFTERYPNVTIERTARSFADLRARLQAAISGGDLPDVVQVNQGWADMGQLVRARLLRPLDAYADLYGWEQRFDDSVLDLSRFSEDGEEFGSESLFGLPQDGEFVGIFYNVRKLSKLNRELPSTFGEFERTLESAREANEIPIQFGNLERWPGIHLFQAMQEQIASKRDLRDFVYGRGDASFDTPANRAAASRLQRWVRAGFLAPRFNTIGYDDAWKRFANGKGVFLITGTWLTADLQERMRDGVGFFPVPPPDATSSPVATGGSGLPFAITSDSENPDAAAAYIDFITNRHAASVIARRGALPSAAPTNAVVGADTVLRDVFEAWNVLRASDGLVPYLDYATPTFYGTLTSSIHELLAGSASPEEFVARLQTNYSTFQELR